MLLLALFVSISVAQTCSTTSATTCVNTATTCVTNAGSTVSALCTCYSAYISCIDAAGCCTVAGFDNLCTTAKNYISQNCASSSGSCFHTDTVITYEGKNKVLAELENSADCAVPHRVLATGTTITARCGTETKVLRLTSNHLVYTQRGLQPAGELLVGKDEVYADIKETQACTLVKVEKDTHQQEFFGLNCYSSSVLASGIKTSTFEKLHSVPAFWMQIVGKVLGIKRASSIGDHIEKILSKLNLI